MGKTLELLVEKGLVDAVTAAAPGRINTSASLRQGVGEVDFVVEAVFEDLALKQQVFADLDRWAPPGAIFTSNTSSFLTSQLAPSTQRPGQVVVVNWWSPPYLLPLIKVVRGPQTSAVTIDVVTGVFAALGKRPVVLQKESLGFIGKRMQFALLREALAGPLEVFDIAGWDTIAAIIDQLFPDLAGGGEAPGVVRDMVGRGDLGVKSGKGFYEWDEEAVGVVRWRIVGALA